MAVTINTPPVDQQVELGGTLTLTVAASGSGTLSYQWKQDGFLLPYTDSATYTKALFSDADRGSYTVVVTDDDLTPVTSTAAVVTVEPKVVTPPLSQNVEIGANITLTVVATGFAPITYQWKKGGSDIIGETASSYTINPFTNADRASYTVAVTCDGNTVLSAAAVLHVQPKITTQPLSQTASAHSTVTLAVVATGYAPITYQWYKGGSLMSGKTAATLQLLDVSDTDEATYTVTVTCDGNTITSDGAILIISTVPVIIKQPCPIQIEQGRPMSLQVVAVGDISLPLVYQWKKDSVNVGTNSATYSVSRFARENIGVYTVTVTNSYGAVISNPTPVTMLSGMDAVDEDIRILNEYVYRQMADYIIDIRTRLAALGIHL